MSKAPEICHYCDGEGNSSAGGRCGFCENGKPLDTQEDWDNSWGRVQDGALAFMLTLPEEDQIKIAKLLELVRKERKNEG